MPNSIIVCLNIYETAYNFTNNNNLILDHQGRKIFASQHLEKYLFASQNLATKSFKTVSK